MFFVKSLERVKNYMFFFPKKILKITCRNFSAKSMSNGIDFLKLGGADFGKNAIKVCDHLFTESEVTDGMVSPEKKGRKSVSPMPVNLLKETKNIVDLNCWRQAREAKNQHGRDVKREVLNRTALVQKQQSLNVGVNAKSSRVNHGPLDEYEPSRSQDTFIPE